MQGRNIGDLLNAKNITWGWFQGGFAPTMKAGPTRRRRSAERGTATSPCARYRLQRTSQPLRVLPVDLEPTSPSADLGSSRSDTSDQAHHQYDLTDFTKALRAGNLPAVSFLKAPRVPGRSRSETQTRSMSSTSSSRRSIAIQRSPQWKWTAIVITYDDSDGWYDHQVPTDFLNVSSTSSTNDASACIQTAATDASAAISIGAVLGRGCRCS